MRAVFYAALYVLIDVLGNIIFVKENLAGINFITEIAIVFLGKGIGNLLIVYCMPKWRKRFKNVSQEIRQGVSLTDALRNFRYFPEMLIQMVSVGEKTAALGEVMTRTYKYFDERVETALNSVTAKIQPVMLLIMGVTVGSLFLAVYSPMLSIMTQLG